MDSLEIRLYHPDDRQAVIELWSACRLIAPQNDPQRDLDRKLRLDPEGVLRWPSRQLRGGHIDGRLRGTSRLDRLSGRGAGFHRRGLATCMIRHPEALLRQAGCPKINCQIRTSNAGVIDFYRQIGFSVDDVVSMGMQLEFDGPKP